MVCSNCGKEIDEKATYCLECGAPIDEPVVLSELKPKNMEAASAAGEIKEKKSLKDSFAYDGPFLDFSGYVKSLGSNPSVLIGLVSAILVYLSPFFTWMWMEHWKVKKSANLFELGGKNAELALGEGVIIVMAILIVLSAIDMLAFSGCRYIGPLKSFNDNYIVRALPIVLTLVFLLVVFNNDVYVNALESIQAQKETADMFGAGYNFAGGKGVGPVLLIVGQVLYAASIFIDYTKRNK